MKTLVSFLNRLVSRFVDSESAKKSHFTQKRKLTMEILENRELLSANIYDDSSTYNDLYFNEQQYSTEQYDNYSNSSDTSTTSDYSTSSSTTLPIYLNNLLDDGNSTFNGTSDYFQISDTNTVDTLDQLTQITVAARFKADVTSGWHYILAHDVETNRGNELFLRIRDNNLQFGYWTTSKNVQAQTPVTADTWYDVVGTYDGTSWKLYLNGELKSTVNDANRNISVSNVSVDGNPLNPVWLIGEHDEVLDRRFWDGEINFVAVYDTALTEDEVEDLYNEKDDWNLTLSVSSGQNGTAFSENHEDTFDVTVKRNNDAVSADKSYPIDFSLTFSGEASKDDFEIYDGDVLISSDSSRWSSDDTIFSYTIPANSTSVVLTFKVLNDADVEGNETLGISLSNATGTINGVAEDFDYSSTTKNVTIKDNDWYISVSTSDTSITEKVSDDEDEDDHYLTYTFSRGDDGDLEVPVEFTFKLTGTAVYSDEWTDFWLYDENDEEIALTYDSTEDAFYGTLAIAADASEVEVKLKPRDNIFYEPDETVTIEVIGVDYSNNDASDPDAITYTLLTDSDSTATITISTEDTLLYPIPEEDRPTMPTLFEPMSIGLQDFDLDPTTLFTPLVIGTYKMFSEGEQTIGDMTEYMSIKIVSLEFVNGDWKYYEIVTWNYDTINADETEHSWGTYTYTFYAWDYDGSQGFTFSSTTEDEYDLTISYDNTDSAQTREGELHQWGESSETIDIESNYSDDNASDERTSTSTDNLSGSGTYSYEVEGGTVSGTFSESEYWYEYSSTDISLTKSDETWTSTGSYSGESSGDSSSDYDGEGNYTIDETTEEGTRNVTGSITESGSTESDYEYTTSGTLSSNGWSMTGTGSENLTEESSYENEESGIYVTEMIDLAGTYIYAYTTETIYYSDEYSIEREVSYSLSDGSWEATSGSETEEAETTDNFEGETNGYTLASGADFRTIYYELTESNYYDEYDITRTVDSSGEWTATSGNSETNEYEKYQSDVMVVTANYDREFEQGTMIGELGWIEREFEEFEYDSESEIDDGEWVLQSGEGYFVQEISYGDFAKGKYEEESGTGNSTPITITESWTNLNGTSKRTDYAVEDGEWTTSDEAETVIDLLEYLYDDESSTIPSNYRTINVDNQTYDDFEDYFVNGYSNKPDSLEDAISESLTARQSFYVPLGLYDSSLATMQSAISFSQSTQENEQPTEQVNPKADCKTHNEVGVLCKYCVLEKFEELYGNNEQVMKAFVYVFKILGYSLDTNSRFWWKDNAVDHKTKTIHIDCRNYGYFTRSITNAAQQLYQVLADDFYTSGTGLPETWETYLYRKANGSILVVAGGGTSVGGGLVVVGSLEPLSKVGGVGAVVFGTNTYYYGLTTFANRAGGTDVITDSMGQYGQWMSGDEGEKSARFWIAVSSIGFETVGIMGTKWKSLTVKDAATNTIKTIKQLPSNLHSTATKFSKTIDDIAKRCRNKFVSAAEKETIAQSNAKSFSQYYAESFSKHFTTEYIPAKTSVAVDVETGNMVGFGYSTSRYVENHEIHSRLQTIIQQMNDGVGFENWAISDCAEFHIINDLLHEAAVTGRTIDFSKLRFITRDVISNEKNIVEPCNNCKYIFEELGIPY